MSTPRPAIDPEPDAGDAAGIVTRMWTAERIAAAFARGLAVRV